MPVLWSGAPGRVVSFPDPAAPGAVRFISLSPEFTFESHIVLLTRLTLGRGVNHQFLHSFGGLVHLYVMGDRIGQLTVSGFAAAASCDDENVNGFSKLMDYWESNKVSAREEEVEVTVASRPIRGFLHHIESGASNPEYRFTEFQLHLSVVPERRPAFAALSGPGVTTLPASGGQLDPTTSNGAVV